MSKQLRVGVKYIDENGDCLYVTSMSKTGILHCTTNPKNTRPFSLGKAQEIQSILETEFKVKAYKVYEQ